MGESWIGIDPGLHGCVAVILSDNAARIFDTPLGANGDYDLAAMANLLRGRTAPVCIEFVHAMPGQGVSSTFKFGRGLGLWEGICAGLNLQVEKVSPQRWKSHYPELKGLEKPVAKAKAREIASRLYPLLCDSFKRVKDADRAEALLMARYLQDSSTDAQSTVLGASCAPRA